ncbi:MAG: hypothetical protein QGG67_21005 [Gammaproteobacteria bacterium]|jgi:hypothetical protein|nr:hypothetical protein [Gammaproteobacteria bacterium]MDP6098424.1 hypothetical protein [Gammaproteobacteria bacterium]MDP7456065.1 hypothetical protein [Gammaproteobacteria bacterium]|tara:strand:+ start:119 stop:349 length:231 start_codon:yes stop_codon:yes gene_type:complete
MGLSKVKTLNGAPLKVEELNIEAPGATNEHPSGFFPRIRQAYKNFSLILAGMYTGVGCSGTPPAYHEYENKDDHPV